MSQFPTGFFNPSPLFDFFFDGIPIILYFQITDVIIFIGFLLILFGLFTKPVGIITSILIIINNGFLFSTGKIDHSFMVWFAFLIMSFSGWGKCFSLDGKIFNKSSKQTNNWTISLISMGLGFGFFVAGLIKLVSGWLSLKEAMLRTFFLRNYYVQQKQDYLAPLFENFHFQAFWELGDWFTIIFEIGFVLVLFKPKIFRIWTFVAILFHGMVLLMMNIAFSSYISLYLLFWMPLFSNSLLLRIKSYFDDILTKNYRILISIIFIITITIFRKCLLPQINQLLVHGFLFCSVLTVTYYIIWKTIQFFQCRKNRTKFD